MRGVFPNPKPEGGARLRSPGVFVRVRLPIGQPHQARLVIELAIGPDQGQRFLQVVDRENRVRYRRITAGVLQEDGLREITEGLSDNDTGLVGGIQQFRPRAGSPKR